VPAGFLHQLRASLLMIDIHHNIEARLALYSEDQTGLWNST